MGHWWTCAVLNCIIASHNRLIYHMMCLRRAICTMSASFTCLTQIIMCNAWTMSMLETSLYPVFLDFVYLSFLRHRTFLYPSLLACTRSFLTHALSLCLHHNNNKSDLVHRAGLDFEIAFVRILCRWMHHILSDSV